MGDNGFRKLWVGLAKDRSHGLGPSDDALTALARAAVDSSLTEFYPFTSMNRLCLSTTPFPFEELQEGFIAFDTDGACHVYHGSPYVAGYTCFAERCEPAEAVRLLVEHLARRR